METKLSLAIKASNQLITNLHRDGLDRGCIATFNEDLVIRESFTDDEDDLHRSLNALVNIASGGTSLYDCMCELISGPFYRKGDRSRPWIMIVVTDGNDFGSIKSLETCAAEICSKYTRENSNFLFLLGVGDDVNSSKMEKFAEKGGFTYIPVKDFHLLEYVFILLALKITNSFNVSTGEISFDDVTLGWAQVQRQRQLRPVAIDYALLIDVSGSMSDRIYGPPPAKCFAGHDLKTAYSYNWYCDICGKDGDSSVNLKYHCESGVACKPVGYCPQNHPLSCTKMSKKWVCDEDHRLHNGLSMRCQRCDYDICIDCRKEQAVISSFTRLLLNSLSSS
ncbi:12858_t:CDS:2 [Acaulospora morrowiae]|uniref:12858_t:CDS:1 n=1 Tax=Acaulospora morrowiae TaxID=94023 RepID=A0A9N9G937_9GLOM|nr:12858_t:CDS:2 [Acaulospora morrowiae]